MPSIVLKLHYLRLHYRNGYWNFKGGGDNGSLTMQETVKVRTRPTTRQIRLGYKERKLSMWTEALSMAHTSICHSCRDKRFCVSGLQ